MDLQYGSEALNAFVSNVGLICSNGPHGYDVMAAEWTHMISYDPGLFAVCLGKNAATTVNIPATGVYGVCIAAANQRRLCSIAGGYSAKEYDKIAALQELGFEFSKGEQIDVMLPEGSALRVECKLVDTSEPGDHMVFVGKALSVQYDATKKSLMYHAGAYRSVGEGLSKPTDEEREQMKAVVQKYQK